jgi:hypothetical protein
MVGGTSISPLAKEVLGVVGDAVSGKDHESRPYPDWDSNSVTNKRKFIFWLTQNSKLSKPLKGDNVSHSNRI